VSEYMLDVHTSKGSKRMKVVLLHLWRINVKTAGGFIKIPVEDLHMVKPRQDNIINCTIIVCRPRQYHDILRIF
jgi:hypothetical protein